MINIINVKPLKEYRLLLTFQNGEIKVFDMKPFLNKGIYKALVDENIFNSVTISFDTIEWKNVADIDPEFLYTKSIQCGNEFKV